MPKNMPCKVYIQIIIYITLILLSLRIPGCAGNVALWKKLDTIHLNLIGMPNTLSQIIKVLLKFAKLKIFLGVEILTHPYEFQPSL